MSLTKANWQPYYGNNHEEIKKPDVIAFGSVSFKRHLGKPLSQELWEDLIHRFHINGLCIYKPNDLRWCLGWPSGHCIITLDKDENVGDINLSPYLNINISHE